MDPRRPTPVTRTVREAARAELTARIRRIAMDQIAQGGTGALTLRGIARQMGVSSSALFRYVPSRDALLTDLIIDAYGSLADAAEAAEAAVRAGPVLERWVAICHGVRDWALAHPHEYALIFGTPVPGYVAPPDTVAPASRVPALLSGLLGDLPHDDVPDLRPATRAAIDPVLATMPPRVPADLAARGLMAWTYLFGAVSFEIFGHRRDVVADPAAFFDHEVHRIATALGLAG